MLNMRKRRQLLTCQAAVLLLHSGDSAAAVSADAYGSTASGAMLAVTNDQHGSRPQVLLSLTIAALMLYGVVADN
jgi:mannose/fructose/N-acetylgalactosamine-specific phosphotransferase system component IIC